MEVSFKGFNILNFTTKEFECPHCGENLIHPFFVENLQMVRNKFGKMIIESGYRCPEHNKEIGGADYSIHQFGLASDIKFSKVNWNNRDEVYELAYYINNKTDIYRIGLYEWGLHLDKFYEPNSRYWYKDNNGYHYVEDIIEMINGLYKEG